MPHAQQPAQTPQAPVFRSSVDLVLVDVVVRDRSGAVVKGLSSDDFELLEDGVRQRILTFAYDEVRADVPAVEHATSITALAGVRAPAPGAPALNAHPLTSDEAAGHRLITLLFDTSSMEPDDVQKSIDGAMTWVNDRMTPADLVAVASIGSSGSSLRVLTDFTSDKEEVRAVLSSLSAANGTAFAAVDASTAATDDAAQSATDEPRVLSRQGESIRDAGRRAHRARRGGSARSAVSVRARGRPLRAGLYICQVNIIDENAGRFAFPRAQLYVR